MKNDSKKFKKEFDQRLLNFSLAVIELCRDVRKDRNLMTVADQIIRSATSVGANVVEAKGSCSKREYIRYFNIALNSANETVYWLMIIKHLTGSLSKQANQLKDEVEQIAKIIASGLITMRGKRGS